MTYVGEYLGEVGDHFGDDADFGDHFGDEAEYGADPGENSGEVGDAGLREVGE